MSSKEVLGHYELGRPLGKGSFSSVRACTDINTGKQYAMKILDKQVLVDQNMGAQVNREIAVMLRMCHRHVCQMRECFQTHDKVYIILELVEGGELFDKIKASKRFEEEVGRKYFQQLILGLNYCHKHGIAHRDLKPENLLLDKHGDIKLSDFGLSNTQKSTDSGRVEPNMMLKTVCGTPNYVAPEVLLEQGYNGFKADMWSAGVILYVMLAGKLPFYDKVMHQLFKKIQTGNYLVPEHFSEGAKTLCGKLLCVKPEDRATIEDVIQDPWFRVGWDDSWLDDGELVRTPSQEQINRAITQLREQREAQERAKRETTGVTPPSSPPAAGQTSRPPPKTKKPHAAQETHSAGDQRLDKEVEDKRRELEMLAKQKEETEKMLEQRRKELEALNARKK